MQQQDDIVFQCGICEGAQQVNSRLGGDLRIVENSSNKDKEKITQSPAAVTEQQILVEFF